MTDPKTLHVWMPDGRSLCDLRAAPRVDVLEFTDEQFEEHMDMIAGAPACGSCLLLAGHVRHHAAVIYREAGRKVFPVRPIKAWERLTQTRWAQRVDIKAFVEEDSGDGKLKYERIEYAIDPATVDPDVTDWDKYREEMRGYRTEHAASETAEGKK
jgi:hypothetical protein